MTCIGSYRKGCRCVLCKNAKRNEPARPTEADRADLEGPTVAATSRGLEGRTLLADSLSDLLDGEQDGYFGGMSGRARRALKRSDYVTMRCAWPSCGKEFAQRNPQIVCCSEECKRLRRNQYRKLHSYKAYRETLTKS